MKDLIEITQTTLGLIELKSRIQALETELIQQALQQSAGNVTRAAEILGIPRYALASKISRYGLK